MVVDQVTSDELDQLFHALSDATRRDIVAQVLLTDQSVTSLASRYPMSFAAVQKHVAVLQQAQLVSKQRRGREQIVSGNRSGIEQARAALDAYEELWRGRVQRMRAVLDEPSEPDVVLHPNSVAETDNPPQEFQGRS